MRFYVLAALVLLVGLAGAPRHANAQASLLPNGKQTFVDANGVPLAGGQVFFYIPSTSTFKDTWIDPGEATPNTNPVVLDAAGRAIIYGAGQYRQVVKDQFGNTIWDQLTQSPGGGGGATSSVSILSGAGPFALSAGQYNVVINNSPGQPTTVTLPAASAFAGCPAVANGCPSFRISDGAGTFSTTNQTSVSTADAKPIGTASATTYRMQMPGQSMIFTLVGSRWLVQ